MKWQYGVTSCKRRVSTLLPQTLQSLKGAGFDQPRIYINSANQEDARSVSIHSNIRYHDITVRNPPVTPYGNWILTLAELFIRDPFSDRYAIFQDDIICCKHLREFLEETSIPEHGYLNLYCAGQNELILKGKAPGWYKGIALRSGPPGFQKGLGALGLVFTQKAVIILLSSQSLVLKPLSANQKIMFKSIDGGVVTAMNNAGWFEYVHYPSLLQHTGHVTTIDNRGGRCCATFPGEEFDPRTLLKGSDLC